VIERAIKIDGITPEAKSAVRAARLDNNQAALLAVAREPREAQPAKVRHIASRKRAPPSKRSSDAATGKSASGGGDPGAPASTLSPSSALDHTDELDHESPASLDQPTPAIIDREDQAAFELLKTAWVAERAIARASALPPEADIPHRSWHVHFGAIGRIGSYYDAPEFPSASEIGATAR
jgi:hypothetical protein